MYLSVFVLMLLCLSVGLYTYVYGAVYNFVGLLFDYEHYCPMGHMTKVLLLHVRLR